MKLTNADIVNQLKQASSGLQCMSEADYPFEVFQWEGQQPLTAETVIQQTSHAPNTPVEVVSPDDFFQNATQDWSLDYDGKERRVEKQ